MPSAKHGKRETGMGEKPSDQWAIPLCPQCHRDAPWALHRVGEKAFFRRLKGDPFVLCNALWFSTDRYLGYRAVMDFLNGLMAGEP